MAMVENKQLFFIARQSAMERNSGASSLSLDPVLGSSQIIFSKILRLTLIMFGSLSELVNIEISTVNQQSLFRDFEAYRLKRYQDA